MITRKQLIDLSNLMILSVVWFAIGWFVHGRVTAQNPANSLIEQIQATITENHVQKLPSSQEMTYAALRGMIQKLDDPYAAFLEPKVAARFQADFEGDSGIVGLFSEKVDGKFVVSVVIPHGAAEEAGLREGDVIVSVDGVVFDSLTTGADVALLLRGPVGSQAAVTVLRNEEVLHFSPTRRVREVVSDAKMMDDSIAYFAQHTFTANAPEEVTAVLTSFMQQQPRAIIWDLRSNGGGSMEAAQQIISQFVESGVLFQVELKAGEVRQVEALGDPLSPQTALVVLVGEHTFSAAETAAASIQDHGRGVLIGSPTFGKGTVQTTMPMPENTAVQFTIAKWLTPDGEWIDGRGVRPDIFVEDNPNTTEDEVLTYALEWIKETVD